jgi:hypothetical protein
LVDAGADLQVCGGGSPCGWIVGIGPCKSIAN